MGDSIVRWVGVRAQDRGMPNLHLPGNLTIGWHAIGGMSWAAFEHTLQYQLLFQPAPRMVFIHLGGNDLLTHSLFKLQKWIQAGIKYLREAVPHIIILWVDILQRVDWSPDRSAKINKAIERKRRRVNRFGRQYVTSTVGGHFVAVDIDHATPGFYRSDGTHLSAVGCDFFLDTVRDEIVKYLGP